MTYWQLLNALQGLTKEQLDCDVTVENGTEDECWAAELRIADIDHDSLDENHPVIYFREYEDDDR